MALALGKLSILVGAGIIGSVLAKEGGASTVSDFFSGAVKVLFKQIRQDDSKPSRPKPQNDSLLAQVNSLRQELQLLASNRSVTIVTSTRSGSKKYGVVVIVLVVGCGYVWWKGWKLPDMMFATKRSLSDACNTIAKQLENVYSSIAATKRHLSSRMDHVDGSLDECAELTAATRDEVSELKGEMKLIGVDVQSVHHAVRTLETKIHRIEGKQDLTNDGVKRLVDYAWNLENSRGVERIQAASSSSRPALELPQVTPSSRTVSLPPIPSMEQPSPGEQPSPSASNGSQKRILHNVVSASGLKELHGISEVMEASSSTGVSNGVHEQEVVSNGNLGSGVVGRKISSIGAFLTRTRSAVPSFK
ncbi:uncharacterized protein LOC127797231 isoform X1 [Diospyros lotus]|uniref:uncharacterized protein LOC127797231 isoform X1 n=1 Tax=Diospyros lotus TaxID=55363 RepID=UPI002259BF00|nr:uncharacterized protein LOC127797231 isoform X1 [Diospyros lotus]